MEQKTEKAKKASNKRTMGKDSEREKREYCGSEEVTQLPDYVIAERCQNAAEEEKSMHIRQRREDEEGEAEG